ncbi:ArsB/NhaD family transporter [Patescibacteria group bacterium]|nr:ArsB/NhaD family transporter [Patescibacteria group bacterium]
MHGIESEFSHITTGAVTAALLIFIGVYALIISEKVHRTVIALFGGAIMIIVGIFLGFYEQDKAIAAVDFNTIGLLIGMMIVVSITKTTGLFQYIAIKAAKFAKGKPWRIMVMFAIITAVFSALLDNVTTVLLMVPMALVICDNLKIKPYPFFFVIILTSNIGGTATLIGDPPNIIIGSAAGLSFSDFLLNLAPISAIIFIATVPLFWLLYRKAIKTNKRYMDKIMHLKEKDSIKDKTLLIKSLAVLGIVIVGFFLHGFLHLDGATIALFGAGLLLLLDFRNLEKVLQEIEWTTIFFFIGLFVLVGGLEQVGVIHYGASKLLELTGGNLTTTALAIMWGGGIFSAFVDNIPFVATMVPLVQSMSPVFSDLNPLWWSLALGACLGGNGTLVGASANLVVAGMAEKSGYKIKFVEFMKVGLLVAAISLVFSTAYVLIRYV